MSPIEAPIPPKRGRPRAEPVEVQRRRVLDVARQVITVEGYSALNVTEVASAAAVSRGTVHQLFGDRERLALAVIDDVLAGLIAAVDAHYAADLDLDEGLDVLIGREVKWFIEALCSDPSILTCIRLSRWLGREAEAEVGGARSMIEEHITSLHQRRTRPFGVERDPSARLIAICVMAIVEVSAGRVVEEGWSLSSATDLIAEFIVGGYLMVETPPAQVISAFDLANRPPGQGEDVTATKRPKRTRSKPRPRS